MYIITGGAGFIGSNILRKLNSLGVNDIIVVDNLKNGEKFKNLVGCKFSNYMDKDDFIHLLSDGKLKHITALIHQGACSDTTERDGKYMMNNNYAYTKSLAEYCVFNDIPFIYASSAAVYGNAENGFVEDFKCENPINIYAYSKYLFDQWAREHLHKASSTFVGLRYFNVYGPREFHKGRMRSMVPQAYEQIEKNGRVRLFGSDGTTEAGEQRRDFIFVKDIVSVVLFFLEKAGHKGIFNVGTGESRSFNDLANAVIDACGKGQIEYTNFPDELRGRYQSYTQANISALRGAGYEKRFTPLEEGVKEYVEWLKSDNN